MDETFKDMIAGAIAGAPYGKTLGLELTGLEEDRAVLFLPYREALTTIGLPFFDRFAQAQEIEAEYVTGAVAGAAEIARDAGVLTLE